jgi:very-short-patch-repair endonuclease
MSNLNKRKPLSLFESESPALKEWDYTKNGTITPHDVPVYSDRKSWWICGRGHSYEARVANRTANGTGCPYCSGRATLPSESFAALYPSLLAEWHFEKNMGIDPYRTSKASSKRVWWKCIAGHEWQSPVVTRTTKKTTCNFCRGRLATPENNAAKNAPEILEFWDWSANTVSPSDLVLSSAYTASWKCAMGHTWTSRIIDFRNRKKAKCLMCTSIKVSRPDLLDEWDFEANLGKDPVEIQPSSTLRVHWVCRRGHKWSSRVADRSRGTGCPRCRSNQTSAPEIRIFSELLWLFGDSAEQQLHVKWRSQVNGKEVDIYIPDLKLCIEHDGEFFHRDKNDLRKTQALEGEGFVCLRLREAPLIKIREHDICYKAGELGHYELARLFDFISENFSISQKLKERIIQYTLLRDFADDKGFLKLSEILPSPLHRDSLAAQRPELAAEWDHEMNSFAPSEVRQYSGLEVYWKCKNGHSWKQKIVSRADHGGKCRTCNSLAFSRPDIAKQWSMANQPVTPESVSRASGRVFWWRCELGHEWKAAVNARTKASRATGCPQCSKVVNQYSTQLASK